MIVLCVASLIGILPVLKWDNYVGKIKYTLSLAQKHKRLSEKCDKKSQNDIFCLNYRMNPDNICHFLTKIYR